MDSERFTYLHLTDFHCGAPHDQWLWSDDVENVFFEELGRSLEALTEPLDLVLFSGDLAFSGQTKEYARVKTVLRDLERVIWDKSGSRPVFLHVPGNHDVDKQASPPAEVKFAISNLETSFWHDDVPNCLLMRQITAGFGPYDEWSRSFTFENQVIKREGVFPGDFYTEVRKRDIVLGIVGLNSSALDLIMGESLEGKLRMHRQQVRALEFLAGGRPKHPTILMTHHPFGWMAPCDRAHIAPDGRFRVHLHGHLHSPDVRAVAEGGNAGMVTMQGCSLFGRSDDGMERLHGYSFGVFEVDEAGILQSFELAPRRASRYNGVWRFGADHMFRLNERLCWTQNLFGVAPNQPNAGRVMKFFERRKADLRPEMGNRTKITRAGAVLEYGHISVRCGEPNTERLFELSLNLFETDADASQLTREGGIADSIAARGDVCLQMLQGRRDFEGATFSEPADLDEVEARECDEAAKAYRESKVIYGRLSESKDVDSQERAMRGLATHEWRLGNLAMLKMEWQTAKAHFEEGIEMYAKMRIRARSDEIAIGNCFKSLADAVIRLESHNLESAAQQLRKAEAAFKQAGDGLLGEALCLKSRGDSGFPKWRLCRF